MIPLLGSDPAPTLSPLQHIWYLEPRSKQLFCFGESDQLITELNNAPAPIGELFQLKLGAR